MLILNHYSPLMHLPPIMAQGLWNGEVGFGNITAVNLTTQTDPDRLACWGGQSLAFKTAVRYVCRLHEDDSRLEPCRELWKRHGLPKRLRDALGGNGQSKWWYVYRGTIKPSDFTVELRGEAGYVPVTDAKQLAEIIEVVKIERDRYESFVPPGMPWALDFKLKDPEAEESWIMGEVFPADRFNGVLLAATN